MLIQKLRLRRGWSQEQLAEVSGLSVRTIQRLERGQPGSLETTNALASVISVIPFLDGAWERRQVEKHLGRQL